MADFGRSAPGEVCLDAKAGDMCVTHCDLLHASTYNTSHEYRYFISECVATAHDSLAPNVGVVAVCCVAKLTNCADHLVLPDMFRLPVYLTATRWMTLRVEEQCW